METMMSERDQYWGPILSTRPLSYSEIIVRSLRLYFASFAHVIGLAFCLSILVFIPRFISYVVNYDFLSTLKPFSPHLAWVTVADILALLITISIFWRLHRVAHYKKDTLQQDLQTGIRKVFYAFIAIAIQSIVFMSILLITYLIEIFLYKQHLLFGSAHISLRIIFTILVFAVQLGIIFYIPILFIFLLPLIGTEDEHIFDSLKKSISLTWNRWWQVFSVQMTPWVCFALFSLCLKFLIGIDIHIYFVDQLQQHPLYTILLQFIIFTFFVIWPISTLYVQLKDIELRKHKLEA